MNNLTHNNFSAKRLFDNTYEIFDGSNNTGLYIYHTKSGWALVNSCEETIAIKDTIKDCLKTVSCK